MRKHMVFCLIVLLTAGGEAYAADTPAVMGKDSPPASPVATPDKPAATPSALPVTPVATAPSASLSGQWTSNLVGDVKIEQAGDKVTGAYHYKDEDEDVTYEGKFEGALKDKTLKAQWWERPKVGSGEESRGDLEWKLSEDGKTMTGWYREEGDKGKEDWNLYRK